MKKNLILVTLVATAVTASGQYKKASFFTRNGKFYGAKTGIRFNGKGASLSPAFSIIAGRDRGRNRIWHWWDIEGTLGNSYSYTTANTGVGGGVVSVSGKTHPFLSLRYNWAFYLVDNKNEENRFLPFVKASVHGPMVGGVVSSESKTPVSSSPKIITYRSGPEGGFDVALGAVYRMNENFSLFGETGYSIALKTPNFPNHYFPFPNCPIVNFGIRLAKKSNDD